MIPGDSDEPTMNPEIDLAIIGGGPGGAALALAVARHGYRVVVCDQHEIPHDKLCGEFLSAEALPLLDALGVREAVRRPPAPPSVDTLRVTSGRGELNHELRPAGLGVSRMRLDGALATACRAAGVALHERWRAVRVERTEHGHYRLHGVERDGERCAFEARLVVAAFGKSERLSDPSALRSTNEFVAWKAHHHGSMPAGTVELHAFPGGYCGAARIEGDRVNVCGIATRAAFRAAGGSVESLLECAARSNAAFAARSGTFERVDESYLTVASMSFERRRPVASRMIHVGDAAALIAPLAGDGMAMALASAHLAAAGALEFLRGDATEDAMLRDYARSWRRAFSRRLVVGSMLQRLFLHRAGATGAVRVLHALPRLTGWLVRATRGASAPAQRAMQGAEVPDGAPSVRSAVSATAQRDTLTWDPGTISNSSSSSKRTQHLNPPS